MAGIALEYEIDLRKYKHLLGRLSGFDTRPLLDDIGQDILDSTLNRFSLEQTPEGEPWQKSLRAQLESNGTTLQDTGDLLHSYAYNIISDDALEVGSDSLYAAIHHNGGTIKAKSGGSLKFKIGDRWAQKQSVDIPARPALGINSDDENKIDKLTRNFIEDLINDH